MIILNTYDDGTQSVLYEGGDKVKVKRDYTYWSFTYKVIPMGTEGTIIRLSVRYEVLPNHNIHNYWVHFKDYGNLEIAPWELEIIN